MKKTEYKVETTLVYPGKFFVFAENEDNAIQLVKDHCWKYHSRACSSLPQGKLDGELVIKGWGFSYTHGCHDIIKGVSLSKRVLPAIKKSATGNQKTCYAVEISFTCKGEFYVLAKDKEEARELVLKYCRQRYPRYRSTLPPDEVAWEFPRKNISKIIGKITEIEGD